MSKGPITELLGEKSCAYFYLTQKCCYYCPRICYTNSSPNLKGTEIPTALAKSLLAWVAGGEKMISGGEPFEHPDAREIITFAAEQDKTQKVSVFTNGFRLWDSLWGELYPGLKTPITGKRPIFHTGFRSSAVKTIVHEIQARVGEELRDYPPNVEFIFPVTSDHLLFHRGHGLFVLAIGQLARQWGDRGDRPRISLNVKAEAGDYLLKSGRELIRIFGLLGLGPSECSFPGSIYGEGRAKNFLPQAKVVPPGKMEYPPSIHACHAGVYLTEWAFKNAFTGGLVENRSDISRDPVCTFTNGKIDEETFLQKIRLRLLKNNY